MNTEIEAVLVEESIETEIETNLEEVSAFSLEVHDQETLKRIIEAAIMVSPAPLNFPGMQALFENTLEPPNLAQIKLALETITNDYADRGIELKEVASGYRFQARAECAPWISRLWQERPPRYSRAVLETLAIIAYRQPATRAEIEEIRGVAVSSNIVRMLMERGWIREVGHKEVPGRPALLATTQAFLDYFNLGKLTDLPSLAELKDLDLLEEKIGQQLELELDHTSINE